MRNNLCRVLKFAARCCREQERGCVELSVVEKEFPEIQEWIFDYFQWDEAKEFFTFDGMTINLKEYYMEVPTCVMLAEINDRCSNND